MKSDKFSLKSRLKSFKYAFDGFKVLMREEHNARVHLVVAFVVLLFALLLKIEGVQWAMIIFAIGFVFVAEIFNTCVEDLCDFVCTDQNPKIKKVKDLAALAVLLSVITAVIVGLIIFVPKLMEVFRS